jgi:hypothetical protein
MRSLFLFLGLGVLMAGCGSSDSSSPSPTLTTQAVNHVHSILVSPSNPNDVLLGGHFALYRSTNGGAAWQPLLHQMMLSMARDPSQPRTLFGVTQQQGLLVSKDNGRNWKAVTHAAPKGKVTGVVFDRVNQVVLAYGSGVYAGTSSGTVWRTDGLVGQSVAGIAVGSDGTEYAATGNGLFTRHPAFASGRPAVAWRSVAAFAGQPVIQVVASGRVAYAAGAISLMKSSNGGATWKELTGAPQGIEFLGLSPSNPNEIFGEVSNQGFMVSHNGGTTWKPASAGIQDRNFNASTIVVAPSSPQIAYTGAWGLHFYATHDGGRHWTRVSSLTK